MYDIHYPVSAPNNFLTFSEWIYPWTKSCSVSCHVSRNLRNQLPREKASCVARSELNFQASCQDSCTRLEDLQPWGASVERLMHRYSCLTWEMKQEEAQMGAQRWDHCFVPKMVKKNHITENHVTCREDVCVRPLLSFTSLLSTNLHSFCTNLA